MRVRVSCRGQKTIYLANWKRKRQTNWQRDSATVVVVVAAIAARVGWSLAGDSCPPLIIIHASVVALTAFGCSRRLICAGSLVFLFFSRFRSGCSSSPRTNLARFITPYIKRACASQTHARTLLLAHFRALRLSIGGRSHNTLINPKELCKNSLSN